MRTLSALLVIALSTEALARVGGGQSFSGGSYSSSGGGGGGGADADLIFLLLRIVLHYPQLGVPIAVIAALYYLSHAAPQKKLTLRSGAHAPQTLRAHHERFNALHEVDPAFSLPAFKDFALLVVTRALQARRPSDWAAIAPLFSAAPRETIEKHGFQAEHVVLASIDVQVSTRSINTLVVKLVGSFHRAQEARYFEQRWLFNRPKGTQSLAPAKLQRLGCPSCGAPYESDAYGACLSCGAAQSGTAPWTVSAFFADVERPLAPLSLRCSAGNVEQSVHLPPVVHPHLGRALRRLQARSPAFVQDDTEARFRHIFLALQAAWSEGDWNAARPFVSDSLFNSYRFWMDRYAAQGLKNRVERVKIHSTQWVRVHSDAWYESITLRIVAEALDYVIDRDQRVLGGDAKSSRTFAEYWTFLRGVGHSGATTDPTRCPSCAAPLDRISQAGVCEYCEAKITTGSFDWVLSQIEQADVYRG